MAIDQRFMLSPLMQLYHWVEAKQWNEKETLRFARNNDITVLLYADMMYRINKNLNAIFGCFGLPGNGKSMVLSFIFWKMEIMFSIDFQSTNTKLPHVSGDRASMRYLLGSAKPLTSYLLDENKKEKGVGSKRIDDEFSDIVDASLRGQSIFFGQACPDYDDSIPHHYVLEPMGIDWTKRETVSILYVPNKKKKLIPIGYIITGMPPDSYVKNYLKKKNVNMINIQRGSSDTRMKAWKRQAKKLIKDPRWYGADTPSEKKIAAEEILPSGLATNEKKAIIAIAKQMQEEDDE